MIEAASATVVHQEQKIISILSHFLDPTKVWHFAMADSQKKEQGC
jgi:hypothetical protein